MAKMGYMKRILKAGREKETVSCKGVPVRPSADFSNLTGKGLVRGQGPTGKITLSSKPIRMEGQVKCFPDQAVHHHPALII